MKVINQKNISYSSILVDKYTKATIYKGSDKSKRNAAYEPFIKGLKKNYCLYDVKIFLLNLKSFLNFFLHAKKNLKRIDEKKSTKKIVFIGNLHTMQKDFWSLCQLKEQKMSNLHKNTDAIKLHFAHTRLPKNKLENIFKQCFLVIFTQPQKEHLKHVEQLAYRYPVLSFVNNDDFIDLDLIDYPLPGNIKSMKGSVFFYNFFASFLT